MKTILTILLLAVGQTFLFSQTTLEGRVTDAETGEAILFGTVAIYKNDVLLTGTETDFDGFYSITEMDAGTYDVVFSYTGYADHKIEDVVVINGKANDLNAKMSAGVYIGSFCPIIPCGARGMISKDETTQGFKFNAMEIRRIAF